MTKRIMRKVAVGLAVIVGLVGAFVGVLFLDAGDAPGKPPAGARLARVERSPEYRDGHFVDMLPRKEPDSFEQMGRWVRGAPNKVPTSPIPIVRPEPEKLAVADADLRVTWLGHSTLLLEIERTRLLIDPVWGARCSPFSFLGPERFHSPPIALDALPPVDAVLISHDHYDHLDYPTVLALAKKKTRFLVPLGVGSHLEHWGVDPSLVQELDWWERTRIKAIELVATPARHFSGRALDMSDRDRTLWSGWAMLGSKRRVYYSGDTAMFPELKTIGDRLGPFDLTMIEVGAYDAAWADVHLGPEQAVGAHMMVKGAVMLPVHWGTFDLALHAWTEPMERVLEAARITGVRVLTPRPGESIRPSAPPAPERWWPELPWHTAAEHPVRSSGL